MAATQIVKSGLQGAMLNSELKVMPQCIRRIFKTSLHHLRFVGHKGTSVVKCSSSILVLCSTPNILLRFPGAGFFPRKQEFFLRTNEMVTQKMANGVNWVKPPFHFLFVCNRSAQMQHPYLTVISFHFHSITEGGPSAGADLQGTSTKKALILQEPNIKVENINFKNLVQKYSYKRVTKSNKYKQK